MKHFLMVAAAVLATAGGCMSNADMIGKVRPRAAFDLACPEQQVEVVRLDGNPGGAASYGATGCGKRARYETSCNGATPPSCVVVTQSIEGAATATPPTAPAAP